MKDILTRRQTRRKWRGTIGASWRFQQGGRRLRVQTHSVFSAAIPPFLLIISLGLVIMLHGCSLIAEFEDDVERMRVRGEALYEDTCASCHGANGEGHAQLDAPALDHSEHAWHHADEQIVHIIRNGGFQMPPVGADLSDSDMESLIAYFKGWWTEEQREIQRGSTGE